ncbi:MAG: sialate O-acetylesterase [Limisphaerales bacterium]
MKSRFIFRGLGALVALGAFVSSAKADVKLPSIIGSHMVLQRGVECPIWGWADPNEAVSVAFAGKMIKTSAGKDGKWSVKLPAMKASAKGRTLTVKGKNTLKLQDVVVGEVWLCSGQSNMEWTVDRSNNPKEEIANGKHPRIRHIKIPHRPSMKAESDVASPGWQQSSSDTVAKFTAVGYFFGRHLMNELDVPIGLIGSNWGGTRIEPWTPPSGFKSVPALKASHADKLDTFPQMREVTNRKTKKKSKVINHQSPLALYNGMISPLVPFAIKGAIWYQGESNNGEGMLYHEKMKALINGWRDLWSNPEMPFYYVQLAPFTYSRTNRPREYELPGIWQAQLATLNVPHTGMAVTTDIGHLKDIHPKNKQDVGKRLALWALAKNYGKKGLVYSGPLYLGHKIKGGKAHVSFTQTGSGLKSLDGQSLTHFEVAGKDKKFVAAKAVIAGEQVVVSSGEVSSPVHVRFGWHETAEPNLGNKEGLPASPFSSSFK